MIRLARTTLVLALAAVLLAACGGSDKEGDSKVSADTRITRCLSEQPEATKDECTEWEKDGELQDDGTHEDHENMG